MQISLLYTFRSRVFLIQRISNYIYRNLREFAENTTRNFAASSVSAATLDSYYLRPSIFRVICESRTICRDNVAYINNMSLYAKHSAKGFPRPCRRVHVCLCCSRYINASCARPCLPECVNAYVHICTYIRARHIRGGNKQCATIAP